MSPDKPTIIAITPVRNEAWVLDAYLACTSTWADYIIIADQHSTDGSREIAAKYDKVICVDNPNEEMNQAEARRILFREVDKIVGDKIVFAIDADEFLSEGFAQTRSWGDIIHSRPNQIFCFKWVNVYGDFSHVLPFRESKYMEWVCHLDSTLSLEEEYNKRERHAIHECRIPCFSAEECSYQMIDEIQFIHLARLNLIRTKNKEDFYQVSTIDKRKEYISSVSLYRSYHHHYRIEELSHPMRLLSKDMNTDYSILVHQGDIGDYYIKEIASIIKRRTIKPFKSIDIWNNQYLKQENIFYNPAIGIRMFFEYLRKTTPIAGHKWVKIIDKILKRFI